MLTINFIEILNGAAELCGFDADNLSVEEFRLLRRFIAKRLQTAWEYEFWPELLRSVVG